MHHKSGLTLIEVTIAVLMLGVGLIAIAGLFPVAGTVQRATYDDMVTRQIADSIQSMVRARGFSEADLLFDVTLAELGLDVPDVVEIADGLEINPSELLAGPEKFLPIVRPVPAKILDGPGGPSSSPPPDAVIEWGLADRSYPSAMGNDPTFINRHYYWVPLVRKLPPPSPGWHIYVFVLKKEAGLDYGDHNQAGVANRDDAGEVPMVRRAQVLNVLSDAYIVTDPTFSFDVGDTVVDDMGNIHTVTRISGNTVYVSGVTNTGVHYLWYGARSPSGGPSPTRYVMTFGNSTVLR